LRAEEVLYKIEQDMAMKHPFIHTLRQPAQEMECFVNFGYMPG